MKFWKKAVSAFLAAVTAVTMLFAGSVTAEAASDGVYVDGFYNTEGYYCVRIGKYALGTFIKYVAVFSAQDGEMTFNNGITVALEDLYMTIMVGDENGTFMCAYVTYDVSQKAIAMTALSGSQSGSAVNLTENKGEISGARYYTNGDGDIGTVFFLPKSSKHLNRLASAESITLEASLAFNNGTENDVMERINELTVNPYFDGLEKQSSSNKTESSKDKPSTSGKLPKKAKTGTPMPEYTVEGYYTSKAKDIYEIVVGGIPEEEYEYLQACAAYFKDEGFIDVTVRSLGDYRFWFSADISGDFSTADLYFDSGNLAGEGKLEKSGNSYTWTLTFDLNSAARKALEKQIKKTKTGLMEVRNSYDISESGNYNSYNYYNGKNSYVSKAVRYNFSNEIKDKSSSSTEIALKATALTAKKSDGKIKLSWKKVDGAEKYQIYYREKGESKYKKLTTVSAGKTSYSTSKLDKNKTYEFKIRSYAESGGKKVYSKYSKTVTVK